MLDWIKALWFKLLTNGALYADNLSAAQWRRRHSRLLVRQIQSSLSLQPIALLSEALGAAVLAVVMWDSNSHALIVAWAIWVGLHLYGAIDFNRRFWADRYRHARIHFWMRAWMLLAFAAGLIWAVAGLFFSSSSPTETSSQFLLVSIILTVTFASWPIYSCWLPSLGVFTLLSVTPLVLRLALMFGWSRLAIALALVSVIVFIFYSGRRFSAIVQMSVRNDQENAILVKRLTLEKKLAEKLRRETEEQSRVRGRFFSAANHDIRQPLQAIGIYTQLLLQNNDPTIKPIVEQLSKSTVVLQTLVAQILEVSRLETGHIKVNKESIKLKALLEDLAAEFEPIARQKGLEFKLKTVDVNVYTDPQLLLRALRNLLNNALAYTQKGSIYLAARLIAGRNVSICVLDSGSGIGKDDQKKIFDTFYRAHATRDQAEGFGLGLSIVKMICDQLQFTLTLSSRLGRGSVFRIKMPVHEAEQARIFNQQRQKGLSAEPVRGCVALVEDNAMVRDSLKALIQNWGATVIAAETMTDAFVKQIRQLPTLDIIVCDFNLGEEQNGLEVILGLSKLRGKTVPSLLLTAVAEDIIKADYVRILRGLTDREAALFAMPRIMQKPVSGEELNQVLRQLTEARN